MSILVKIGMLAGFLLFCSVFLFQSNASQSNDIETICESTSSLEKRGCCSWHNGVCGCSNGRALCCDGTLSPSCGCHH